MKCHPETMESQNTITKLGNITEYPLNWPSTETGSTHELVIDKQFIYVTGQNMARVAKLDYEGTVLAYFEMPENSGPHGILLDKEGKLWVSLEFHGKVVQLDDNGKIVQEGTHDTLINIDGYYKHLYLKQLSETTSK